MSGKRVVITGMGVVSPHGSDLNKNWEAIKNGVSAVAPISVFDTTDFTVKIAAEVSGLNIDNYFTDKEVKKLDLFTVYGLIAAQLAIEKSGVNLDSLNLNRFGCAVGAGIGGLATITKSCEQLFDKPRRVSPFFIPASIINIVAGHLSIKYGLKGPNISIVTACTTGAHNIGYAYKAIKYGDADYMLAGGTEMSITPLGIAGFQNLKALSKRNDEPTKASRPWDQARDGFVLGAGAAILVLEDYEAAKKRGANIVAEIIGAGSSADAYHITSPTPDGDGALRSMLAAVNDAQINSEDIDYINAHGTSTPAGDEVEVNAVKSLISDHKKITMSSTKSMTGHLLGAAGAIEAIYSILAIKDNVAPPTINLDNPYEGCDINLVPNTAQEKPINIAMSNSFGFGGTNGSLIFKSIT